MRSTCLVIPCYNEAARLNLPEFIDGLQNNPLLCLVFVNDGSKDQTASILFALHQNAALDIQSRLHILNIPTNQGKAEAVRNGLLFARNPLNYSAQHSALEYVSSFSIHCDYYGFWDADLATPLSELEWFYDFQGNTDRAMIIGSRIARLGSSIERTLFRHYSGRLFATLISQGLGWKVHDSQCGAKIMQPELIPICFNKAFYTSWLFDVEILLRMQQHYGKNAESMVIEVPLTSWKDVKGSKIGWSDFIKIPFQIWRVFRAYKR